MSVSHIREDQARAAVEALCAAPPFRCREPLCRLLRYLAERTFDGSAAALKEYSLGVDLFGKPETYDPREDATVRIQVSKLRHLLEDYYKGDGAEAPLSIELPKRQLGLVFHTREAAPAAAPVAKTRTNRWAWLAATAAMMMVAFVAGRALPRRTPVDAVPPALAGFWKPVIENGRPTVVCLGTPLFVRFQGARVISRGIEDIKAARQDPKLKEIQRVLGSPTMDASHIYTGVGEAAGAFQLARMFTTWGKPLDVRRNAALTWEDISEKNLVFLGSAKYNPQLRQLPHPQNFLAEIEGVANSSPRPGEAVKYFRRHADDPERSIIEDYAVISRLPGPNGRTEVVILGASATEGTAAAVQQVSDPNAMARLLARIKDSHGNVPRYFEILIRAHFRSMVPVKVEYETHRVFPAPVSTAAR